VTTLDQPIKVPKDLKIFEICAIAKMNNTISKTLANYMVSKLALIQFDIAGPFPTSFQGNRYFLLIIDSYICKNWVLVLKEKSKRALEGWKTAVELETNMKIKAARSNNAPELV
jgi:hypothetical protein